MNRRAALAVLAGLACLPASLAAHATETRRSNASLMQLPRGHWTKVHEQRREDAVTFRRQSHGGSAFDNRRGRLVLFGSDTHGKDWTNSPLFFDLATLSWSRLYPDDHRSTYAVNAAGLPVAGPNGDHPWAMHTFGAVAYDPGADELIVASYPKHMQPGRFTDALAHVWPMVKRHPTWILDMETGTWKSLQGQAVHFFPYCVAFDTDRGVLVGYSKRGVYELSGAPRVWRKVESVGLTSYHNNAVYDSRNGAVVVFGSKENSNDTVVFEPSVGRHQKMAAPGVRPAKDQHAPMAFHGRLGETFVLADRQTPGANRTDRSQHRAETWSYDLARDSWTYHEDADLPFTLGMNYNMDYDPLHDLLLLVADEPGGPPSVWALKL